MYFIFFPRPSPGLVMVGKILAVADLNRPATHSDFR